MSLKAKLKEVCDKAEIKLEQFGQSTAEFINEHPKLILTTTFASFIGLMSWSIAASVKDMNEETNQYEELFDKLNSLEIAPGEQVKVTIGKDGIKKIIYSYEAVTKEEPEEAESEPDDVEIVRF